MRKDIISFGHGENPFPLPQDAPAEVHKIYFYIAFAMCSRE